MLEIDGWTFILIGLATFRLTRLIVFDRITEFIRKPFLEEFVEQNEQGQEETYIVPKGSGIRKWMGELLSCYWCTGIWVSFFWVLFYLFYPNVAVFLILIFALAGFAAIIETIISRLLGE